jgi:UDP-2,3-diacylglucosamine pyrophosphatase LpxH
MAFYCVSDLHLSDRGPRDNFAARGEDRFLRFLDFVDSKNGRLLILGDLFDWWTTNLSRSVNAYRSLLERLSKAQWVVGNHDGALTRFIGTECFASSISAPSMSKAFEETIAGKRFAFLHGHEADPYCRSPNPGVGDITAIISGLLEDRNQGPNYRGHPIEDEFVGTLEAALTIWRKLTDQAGRLEEMVAGAEAYRKAAGADVVVSGHTHVAGSIGDYHWNCGCWCRDKDTFVEIDEDTGMTSLWEWDGKQEQPFTKDLR